MKKKKYLKTLLVMPIILIGLILISSNDEKYKENASQYLLKITMGNIN